ncbi:MAG: hypothetical protein AUG51_15685 [Acidobacteria bacterium 13_1_20CM_3_53_8]|nr:MAG: hypothetical protein AUG51_15685 [Acidobacteria bacterium 13_1_20CM_3_53_8]
MLLLQERTELTERSRTLFTLAFALLFPLSFIACPGGNNAGSQQPVQNTQTNASPSPQATAASAASFDANRAFEHVRKQVEFGPRPAGSAELAKTRDYIVGELKSYGLKVTEDEFNATTPVGQRKMVNVIAELPGESSDVIIVSSHYDTKLFKQFRFVGANDAGSSTGTLIELARVMAASGRKPRFTYWFTFFDGEEAFCEEWEQCHNPNPSDPARPLPDNTYGSRHMVDRLKSRNELKRVRAMILLDMMGYKQLQLGRDDMSTRWLVDIVWQTGKELGHGAQFLDRPEGVGGDDHEGFVRAEIPSLDIIQLSTYQYWHTPDDTLDKVSPQSLKIVGDTLLASFPKIEERLAGMH